MMRKVKLFFFVIAANLVVYNYGWSQKENISNQQSKVAVEEKEPSLSNTTTQSLEPKGEKTQGGPALDSSATTSQEETTKDETAAYVVKLKDLQQRVDRLKEQIFRSKSRLSLLSETVLQGSIAGSKAVVLFKNSMGSSFRLVKAIISLDGAPILNKMSEAGIVEGEEEIQLFNGSIVPGEHILNVNLEFRGHGYGIFSYLKGYRFRVRSSHGFTATEGKMITVKIESYEKGGPMTPLEERPAVRYMEKVQSGLGEGSKEEKSSSKEGEE